MKAKLVPLPHEQRERGWINCWKYMIDLTSCSMYRHVCSTCKWYLLFVNWFCQKISKNCKLKMYFAREWSPWQYFCWGDYYSNTVCLGKILGKILGNCQLSRWILRAEFCANVFISKLYNWQNLLETELSVYQFSKLIIYKQNNEKLNMVLLGGINNSNQFIIKNILIFWLHFPLTIFREYTSKNESWIKPCIISLSL